MKKSFFAFVTAMLLPMALFAQAPFDASGTCENYFGHNAMWIFDSSNKVLTICSNNGEDVTQESRDISVFASDDAVNKLGSGENWTYTKGVQKSFDVRSGIYISSVPTYDEKSDEIGEDFFPQNYRFVDFVPTSGNITVGFNVPNTLSGMYDIYVVTCPMWLKDDYNNIPQEEWDVRPYRFTATIIELDDEGVNIGQFPTKGKTLENPNPIDDKQKTIFLSQGMIYDEAGHIIVNDTIYLGKYTFKNAYYGKDYGVIIQIASSILSSQRSDFSNEMLISSILLKPCGNNTNDSFVGIQSDVEHVAIKNGITEINYAFGAHGFQKLSSVLIGDDIKKIKENTFANCRHLTEVVLGSNVESLGEGAFDNCLVTRIYSYADYPPEVAQGNHDTKESFSVVKTNCKLFVKPTSIDLYRVDPYWGQFNIQPMSEEALAIENLNILYQGEEIMRYTQGGIKTDVHQKGVNIIRYSDGSTQKVFVK